MAIFDEKIEIRERCKGVHCVDLDESFPTSIYLQNLASIQLRTSPKKLGKTGKRDFEISFALTPARAFEIEGQIRSSWRSGSASGNVPLVSPSGDVLPNGLRTAHCGLRDSPSPSNGLNRLKGIYAWSERELSWSHSERHRGLQLCESFAFLFRNQFGYQKWRKLEVLLAKRCFLSIERSHGWRGRGFALIL